MLPPVTPAGPTTEDPPMKTPDPIALPGAKGFPEAPAITHSTIHRGGPASHQIMVQVEPVLGSATSIVNKDQESLPNSPQAAHSVPPSVPVSTKLSETQLDMSPVADPDPNEPMVINPQFGDLINAKAQVLSPQQLGPPPTTIHLGHQENTASTTIHIDNPIGNPRDHPDLGEIIYNDFKGLAPSESQNQPGNPPPFPNNIAINPIIMTAAGQTLTISIRSLHRRHDPDPKCSRNHDSKYTNISQYQQPSNSQLTSTPSSSITASQHHRIPSTANNAHI